MTFHDYISTLRQFIESHDWCQSSMALDKEGNKTSVYNNPHSLCFLGSITSINNKLYNELYNIQDFDPRFTEITGHYNKLQTLCEEYTGSNVVTFNDTPQTTKQSILNLLDKILQNYPDSLSISDPDNTILVV